MSEETQNTVGIDIPLPGGKIFNTEYPKIINGEWVNDVVQEFFYRD